MKGHEPAPLVEMRWLFFGGLSGFQRAECVARHGNKAQTLVPEAGQRAARESTNEEMLIALSPNQSQAIQGQS
ncbi:hypothetical protein TREES_T100000256 [Tupaia chinensis]|uniref:Uncharacterized protein n=1 Tax=Tupaia chinensis TaxID=246437 RepID=L9L8P1_TUPCH|nr:hypothetical protein TREES_T100000256 [Tupaia chinensis]